MENKIISCFLQETGFYFKKVACCRAFECLKISFLQSLSNLSSCDHGDDIACVAYERADEDFANEHLWNMRQWVR